GDSLGKGDRVRIDPGAAAREPVADPAVAADHLVRHEEHAVPAAELARVAQIALRRCEDAAGADDRLAEERGDPLGADLLDTRLEGVDGIPGDAGGVTGERADTDLEGLRADDARAVAGEAVVCALPRDDHGSVRAIAQAPVAAHELDRGLDGLAAAARE